MKQIVIMILWLVPLFVSAQETSAIKFSSAINWRALLEEAKQANKPIFVDAFATWCGPCKKMDQEVFREKNVTDFINENYVAIRVQMDPTKNDSDFIKGWQKEAAVWDAYIKGYPCFLFFTQEGELAGKYEGERKAADFLTLLQSASNPANHYQTKLQRFRGGKLNKNELLGLALFAHDLKDSTAITIAQEYKSRYIDYSPLDTLLNPKIGRFLNEFYQVFDTHDSIITYMNQHPDISDSLFQRGNNYSRQMSDYLISRDYIHRVILPNNIPVKTTPEWEKMYSRICRDFDTQTGDRIILNEKISWALRHKFYNEATKHEFEKIERYGMDTTAIGRGMFNNMIYSIVFTNVDDIGLLKKAAFLMKHVNDLENKKNATYLDTYAGILYKSGNKQKAIAAENAALKLARKQNKQEDVKFYVQMIERMKMGEEIWKEEK